MSKQIIEPKNGDHVSVLAVSNGTPDFYVGRLGTVTDVTRGIVAAKFDDGKTQHFTLNELEVR